MKNLTAKELGEILNTPVELSDEEKARVEHFGKLLEQATMATADDWNMILRSNK